MSLKTEVKDMDIEFAGLSINAQPNLAHSVTSSEFLFDPSVVSKDVKPVINPEKYRVRPLSIKDYSRSFMETLADLTVVGETSKAQFEERFNYMRTRLNEYFVIVIEDIEKNIVVGSGTIFIERKFIRNCGLVGHIEDIVVSKDYRSMKFGKLIIDHLKHIGHHVGCYKIILDCEERNVGFYEKCGFKVKGSQMAWYIDEKHQ